MNMTHFMGFSMPADGRTIKQAKRIHTGKEHEHVKVTLTRPMRRDIRTVSADEPVDWKALYDWCGARYRISADNHQ